MKDLIHLWRLVIPYWTWLGLGIALALVTVLANVALLAISGWFITAMALAGLSGVGMNYFTPAAFIRLFAILRTGGRYAERLVTHEATLRILAELRVWFYQRIEPLAPAGLASYHSGDILSRIRADIDTLNNAYLRLFVPITVAFLASLLVIGVIAYYSVWVALLEASLLGLAGVILPWWLTRKTQSLGQHLTLLLANLRAQTISGVQGMGELLVYGAAVSYVAGMQQTAWQISQTQQTLNDYNALAQSAVGWLANLALWGTLWLTLPLLDEGLTAPTIVMLSLLSLASFEALNPLPVAFQSLGETLSAARRLFSLADQLPTIQEPKQALAKPENLAIEFRKVSFSYPNTHNGVLKDMDLTVTQGQKIAIMGATGAGKSTISALLLRFWEVTQGQILLNHYPIQAYASEDLRQQMSVASQQSHLFNTTIRQNLLLAKPDATQAELDKVCRLALIHDFIDQQPQGYATWIGETGIRLSGGQARRLTIARALLKPAKLLILDEPTEGLDIDTATLLMQNVISYLNQQGQSLLLITHNTVGLSAMDAVYRLQEGVLLAVK